MADAKMLAFCHGGITVALSFNALVRLATSPNLPRPPGL